MTTTKKPPEVEYITVLWGMSLAPERSSFGAPRGQRGGAMHARMGQFTQTEMINYLLERPIGTLPPPFDPCVVRVFEFKGSDATKLKFMRLLSGQYDPFDFGAVFRDITSNASYGTLMNQRKWRWTSRLDDINHIQAEVKFLKAGKSARSFNYWPTMRRFENMVRTEIKKDPMSFESAIWTKVVRDRRTSKTA